MRTSKTQNLPLGDFSSVTWMPALSEGLHAWHLVICSVRLLSWAVHLTQAARLTSRPRLVQSGLNHPWNGPGRLSCNTDINVLAKGLRNG